MKIKTSVACCLAQVSLTLILTTMFSTAGMGSSSHVDSAERNSAAEGRTQSDEDRVRRAYLKLQFYHSAGKRYESAKSSREHVPYDDIDIYIYNMYTGSIDEIRNRKYFDLVTAPTDEVIQLSSYVRTYDKNPTEYLAYEAKWVRGRYVPPSLITVGQIIQAAGPAYSNIEKFTSYEVRVRLDGREKMYKALALYHSPAQSESDGNLEYMDLILGGGGALTRLSKESRPAFGSRERRPMGKGSESPSRPNPKTEDPSNLNEPDPRKGKAPSVNGHLPIQFERLDDQGGANLLFEGGGCDYSGICCPFGAISLAECCTDPMYRWGSFLSVCSSGGGGGYYGGYDGYAGGGGAPAPANDCLAETYYANPINNPDGNEIGHITGRHGGDAYIQSFCKIESSCSATCDADFLDVQQYEYGTRWIDVVPTLGALLWHSLGPIEKRSFTATGYVNGNNTPPTCSAAVAFNVQTCLMGTICNYGVTISGGNFGVSVSSSDDSLFTYGHTTTHTCPKFN